MKIFEATTLLSAAKQRVTEYKELRSQMTNLKNAFQGMADLGDSDFSGKGADNIKALFQDHAGVTDEWLELIDMKIAFLTSIEAMIEDAGLSDSYVEESFLEHELTNALDKSKAIMQEQRNEMKGILDEIADILPLDLFSTDNADQKLDDSDTTKRDTIHKIGELDNNLSNEYGLSEANEAFIMADFQALQDATGKGKNATPLNYNAKAYRENEIHQMQAGLHKQSSEYLSFKKQQAEERRIAKEQEELANRPWYEKRGVLFVILQERLPDITIISGLQMELTPLQVKNSLPGNESQPGEWLLPATFRLLGGQAASLKAEKQSIQLEKRYTRLIKRSKYIKLPKPFMHWRVLKKGFMA
ncbi:ribonuclease YeeF family protein [Bacillus sp. 4A_MP3]